MKPYLVSLERIDVNGNYTKENCCWIKVTDQQSNTRANVKFKAIFPDGHEEYGSSVRRFAKANNLDPGTITDVMNPKVSTKQHRGFKFIRLEAPFIFDKNPECPIMFDKV